MFCVTEGSVFSAFTGLCERRRENEGEREKNEKFEASLRGGLDLTSILGRVHSRPASSRGKCSITSRCSARACSAIGISHLVSRIFTPQSRANR